jgi:hypothetical protein
MKIYFPQDVFTKRIFDYRIWNWNLQEDDDPETPEARIGCCKESMGIFAEVFVTQCIAEGLPHSLASSDRKW